MSATEVFYCTAPTVWPDPFLTNPRYKGPANAECWAEFGSPAERTAHQAEAHAAWHAERLGRPVDKAIPTLVGEVELIPEPQSSSDVVHTTKPVNPASAKQLAFIAALAERKGVEANEVKSAREASAEIDRLTALPDPAGTPSFRKNKFAGPCSDCGNVVPAEEGVVRKTDDGWQVGHLSCPDEPKLPAAVPDGFYAVTAEAGHTSFYGVKAGRKPGVVFVDLLTGGGPNGTFNKQSVPFQSRDAVLAKIAADIEGAATRFGQESGRCCKCNRGLTDEASRERGIGPECNRRSGE